MTLPPLPIPHLPRLVAIPLVALVLFAAILSVGILQLVESARWVDHTDQVIAEATDLQKLMLDEETGIRGYLLTSDKRTLAPWNLGRDRIEPKFEHIAKLIADNPAQQATLGEIRRQHAQWQHISEMQLSASRETAATSLLLAKFAMDAIREQINNFVKVERRLRDQREARSALIVRTVLFGAWVLSLIIGTAIAIWLFRNVRALLPFQFKPDNSATG